MIGQFPKVLYLTLVLSWEFRAIVSIVTVTMARNLTAHVALSWFEDGFFTTSLLHDF
jgi:hypothetical protein